MKNKIIKLWIGIAAMIAVAGTTVAAGTYTNGLSVGGSVLVDGGIKCNTSVNIVTTEPTSKSTNVISAGAAAVDGLGVETVSTEKAAIVSDEVNSENDENMSVTAESASEINAGVSMDSEAVLTEEETVRKVLTEKKKDDSAGQTKLEKLETVLAAELEAEAAAEAEAEASMPIISVGATLGTDLCIPDEGEEEDDTDTFYGYSNLGIAIVDDHLNVRETADDASHIVGKMSNDSGCEILEIVDGKAHIVSGSVEGYVSTDYILTGDMAVTYAGQIVKKLATVSADGLKVRTAPDLEAPVVNMVAYGEELEVVEGLDGWVKVLYDGEEVYVNSEYVTVGENLKTALNMSEFLYGSGVSDVRVSLCEYAKQFIGNPYVWGGTSLTKGADCSGYVLSIYAKYGISLPHSSRAQANMGKKVSVGEARPGDLVFYSKGGRINHVAIYIGGGQVVHASSPKYGIRITSVYYRTPTTVRRIIQD